MPASRTRTRRPALLRETECRLLDPKTAPAFRMGRVRRGHRRGCIPAGAPRAGRPRACVGARTALREPWPRLCRRRRDRYLRAPRRAEGRHPRSPALRRGAAIPLRVTRAASVSPTGFGSRDTRCQFGCSAGRDPCCPGARCSQRRRLRAVSFGARRTRSSGTHRSGGPTAETAGRGRPRDRRRRDREVPRPLPDHQVDRPRAARRARRARGFFFPRRRRSHTGRPRSPTRRARGSWDPSPWPQQTADPVRAAQQDPLARAPRSAAARQVSFGPWAAPPPSCPAARRLDCTPSRQSPATRAR